MRVKEIVGSKPASGESAELRVICEDQNGRQWCAALLVEDSSQLAICGDALHKQFKRSEARASLGLARARLP